MQIDPTELMFVGAASAAVVSITFAGLGIVEAMRRRARIHYNMHHTTIAPQPFLDDNEPWGPETVRPCAKAGARSTCGGCGYSITPDEAETCLGEQCPYYLGTARPPLDQSSQIILEENATRALFFTAENATKETPQQRGLISRKGTYDA